MNIEEARIKKQFEEDMEYAYLFNNVFDSIIEEAKHFSSQLINKLENNYINDGDVEIKEETSSISSIMKRADCKYEGNVWTFYANYDKEEVKCASLLMEEVKHQLQKRLTCDFKLESEFPSSPYFLTCTFTIKMLPTTNSKFVQLWRKFRGVNCFKDNDNIKNKNLTKI